MIFNTITDSITGATQSIRLFGKSSNEIKNIMGSLKQNGIKHTLFSMPLAEIDQQAIDDYNKYIRLGLPYEDALANARKTTNADTLSLIESSKGLVIQEEQITAAQNASTIASKAKSAALGALSSFGNMAFFALVSEGISLAATAIDNWIHKTEKANEAMDEAVSSYESAKSSLESVNSELDSHNQRINELLSKEKLSYVEQGELEELQAITQELLTQKEIEERKTDKASKEAAKATINAFNEQYGDYDISEEQLETKMKDAKNVNFLMADYADEDDVLGNIVGYQTHSESAKDAKDALDKAKNEGADSETIKALEEDFQAYVDEADAYGELVDQNITDLQTKKLSLSDEYSKAIQTRETAPYKLTTDDQDVIKTYEDINNALRMIYSYKDTESWNEMEFSDIFSTDGLEKSKEELMAMANSGELTADDLNGFEHIRDALKDADLILENGQSKAMALYDYILGCAQASDDFGNGMQSALSFTDAWESLDSTEDESLKSLKKDLLSLAEAGELTVESFKATEGSGSFLAQLGIDKNDTARIKGVVDGINKMRSSASKLSSMKDGISSLSGNLYAKEQNPGTAIGKDVLNGMDDGLKTQTAEWNNYVAVMGNSSSSIEDAKKATADLAAAYINSSSSLAGLTDSEKEHYAAQLNAMGLTGAQEALESSIAAARAAETLGLDELSFATEESANQTYAQINALINEGEITGTTAAALFHLIATEQIFANQSLNTSGKIAELNRLALAFGIVADSSALAAEISDKSNMMARAGKSTEYIRNETGKVLGKYTAGIEAQINNQSGGKTPGTKGSAISFLNLYILSHQGSYIPSP